MTLSYFLITTGTADFNLHSWMPRAFGRNHTYNNIWGQAMRIRETWARVSYRGSQEKGVGKEEAGQTLPTAEQQCGVLLQCGACC
jgi:hypothetical protein